MNKQYRVLPQRNQFGMVVVVDEEGDIVKFTKSITSAAQWIVDHTTETLKGEKI